MVSGVLMGISYTRLEERELFVRFSLHVFVHKEGFSTEIHGNGAVAAARNLG